jgi:hypothetical protein
MPFGILMVSSFKPSSSQTPIFLLPCNYQLLLMPGQIDIPDRDHLYFNSFGFVAEDETVFMKSTI